MIFIDICSNLKTPKKDLLLLNLSSCKQIYFYYTLYPFYDFPALLGRLAIPAQPYVLLVPHNKTDNAL